MGGGGAVGGGVVGGSPLGGSPVGGSLLGGSDGGLVVVVTVEVEVVYVAVNPLNSNIPSVMSSTVRTFPTEE